MIAVYVNQLPKELRAKVVRLVWPERLERVLLLCWSESGLRNHFSIHDMRFLGMT
jgi:hypothetical protein